MSRHGCSMTLGSPRTARTRPGSSVSTRGRWARPVTVRSGSPCTRSERVGRCRWDGRCICRRTGARISSGGTKAKIPEQVEFKTKPELGVELVERASGWKVPRAPVLGDHAYGENTWLRDRLDQAGCEYVLSVGPKTKVFEQGTSFAVPAKKPKATRGPVRPRPDRKPEPIGELIGRLGSPAAQTVTFRDEPDGEPVTSRFIFARVHAAHGWRDDERRSGWREGAEVPPREEWLIAEWPDGHDEPTDYWISNLAADTAPERLARLARMRWKMELDYKQLKGELGLDHYEGRSWLGWYHHTALVSAAHGFLTLERLNPFRPRPA